LRQVPSSDRTMLLTLIFKYLKQLSYGNLPFAQRYGLAKNLLLNHRELHTKRTTRVALSLLYCASLIGGIMGTLQAITQGAIADQQKVDSLYEAWEEE
jgi:hypothetical protein